MTTTQSDPVPKRGYRALRKGRYSKAHLQYFLTLCSTACSLDKENCADQIRSTLLSLEKDHSIELISYVVMPDHLHLLFRLGDRLSLGQVIGRLKAQTRAALNGTGNCWQDSFYDHAIRPDDSIEAVLRYIYLNPCKANLVSTDDDWPHYFCRDDVWRWFSSATRNGKPFPEWLR